MKKVIKRVLAYVIDVAIISIVVTLLTSNTKINYQYNNYEKGYKEYNEVLTKYNKVVEKEAKLENKYKDDKINKKSYHSQKNKYDKKMKEYELQVKQLNRTITRNSVIYYAIYIAFVLAYFGIFQYSFNGQTFGKRLMQLKIINNKNEPLKIWQTLLRTFILFNLWYYIVILIISYCLNGSDYYSVYSILNNINSVISLLIVIMLVMNKDGRSLHDYISFTKVVALNELETVDEQVIEAEVVKPKRKKKGDK